MANWLIRASWFQPPPPVPEPFEVECDCGSKVTGFRTKNYQRPSCDLCERPVFVLPANIYPVPKTKSSAKSRAKDPVFQKSAEVPTKTVVDPGPAPEPPKISSFEKTSRKGAAKTPARKAEPVTNVPRRPIMTPIRCAVAVFLIVTSLGAWGVFRRQQFENAKSNVARAADAGQAALEKLDFATASLEFDRARSAVDVLGRNDPAANEIRSLSRETTVLHKLASGSLTEMLQVSLSMARLDQAGAQRLSNVDRNGWVIFDARVTPVEEGSSRYVLEAPMVFSEADIRIEIETAAFRGLNPVDDTGEGPRAIFAAQLDELSVPSGEPPVAILTLNSKTAFLWTNYETLSAAGYRPYDAESEQLTRSLLEQQSQMQ